MRINRYALLDAEGPLPMHVLASYDDGAPALVESPVGQGRVLLFTSSASAAWNDWPLRPSFLAGGAAGGELASPARSRSARRTPAQVGEPRS